MAPSVGCPIVMNQLTRVLVSSCTIMVGDDDYVEDVAVTVGIAIAIAIAAFTATQGDSERFSSFGRSPVCEHCP